MTNWTKANSVLGAGHFASLTKTQVVIKEVEKNGYWLNTSNVCHRDTQYSTSYNICLHDMTWKENLCVYDLKLSKSLILSNVFSYLALQGNQILSLFLCVVISFQISKRSTILLPNFVLRCESFCYYEKSLCNQIPSKTKQKNLMKVQLLMSPLTLHS